ncbi:MAG: hypothetical protein IJP80_05075, partial [Bacteroidales bacterium]|nr:hypothetical protein [Bacteroidales bacterium]
PRKSNGMPECVIALLLEWLPHQILKQSGNQTIRNPQAGSPERDFRLLIIKNMNVSTLIKQYFESHASDVAIDVFDESCGAVQRDIFE